MIRSLLIVVISCACVLHAAAQGEDNSLKGTPFKERIVTGGGFGLSFGTAQDFISVSPMLGYMITRRLVAGASLTYRYTNLKIYSPAIKLNDYGVSPFARFMVYKSFFVQAEYEYLNYEFPVSQNESIRKSFGSFLAGGGVIQPVSDKVSFYIMALYNFSYVNPSTVNQYSPYDSPLVLRAGINIGNFGF